MSLTKEKILDAAREVVRRHGPSKATVVDVAQALGVSHGSIYRFFPTKAALREAVVAQWLAEIVEALEARTFTGSALERLRSWFDAYFAIKRAQRDASPELFAAFRILIAEVPDALAAYKNQIATQVAGLLEAGCQSGEFRPLDALAAARALISATVRFHNPSFAHDWDRPEVVLEFQAVWDLVTRGLMAERKTL